MTESARSLLLFTGLVAGPAGAFLIRFQLLPVYIVFPLIGLIGPSRRGMLKVLLVGAAPLSVLLFAVISGNGMLIERAVRWLTAVAAGAAMSGALGASRTASLLHRASAGFPAGGILENMAMVTSLAGPCSKLVSEEFRSWRGNGSTYMEALVGAVSSLDEIDVPKGGIDAVRPLDLLAAAGAWILLLLAIAGTV